MVEQDKNRREVIFCPIFLFSLSLSKIGKSALVQILHGFVSTMCSKFATRLPFCLTMSSPKIYDFFCTFFFFFNTFLYLSSTTILTEMAIGNVKYFVHFQCSAICFRLNEPLNCFVGILVSGGVCVHRLTTICNVFTVNLLEGVS